MIDGFIANDENTLPGITNMLFKDDKETQELVSKILDYLSITKDNQTLICCTDKLISGVVHLLRKTTSNKARNHILQALIYLSSNPNNR